MNQVRFEADNLVKDGVSHGFFTRNGGMSSGDYATLNCGFGSDDRRENVEANRAIVLNELNASHCKLITPFQRHSPDVIIAEGTWEPSEAPRGDAIVTNVTQLAIGVLTADCAPVLLVEPEAGIIGAAHAGWRGALGGVLENVVDAMVYLGGTREKINAAIGPTIAVERYEIGQEFKALVLREDAGFERFFVKNEVTDRFHFDLPAFAVAELEKRKIGAIEMLSGCTYENDSLFYSARRNFHHSMEDYGRQISVIVIN